MNLIDTMIQLDHEISKYNNNNEYPTMKQISSGLISEAMLQLALAMGNVDEQKYVLEAKANITKTWEDLFNEVKNIDRNQPLEP